MVIKSGATQPKVSVPVQLSFTVPPPAINEGRSAKGVGTADAHCTVTAAGGVILGATLSFTMIVSLQVAELPQASTAL